MRYAVRYIHKISQTCSCGHPQYGHAADQPDDKLHPQKWGEGKCRSSATCACLNFEHPHTNFELTLPEGNLAARKELLALAKELRRAGVLGRGARLQSARQEKTKTICWPKDSIWHSIIMIPLYDKETT